MVLTGRMQVLACARLELASIRLIGPESEPGALCGDNFVLFKLSSKESRLGGADR